MDEKDGTDVLDREIAAYLREQPELLPAAVAMIRSLRLALRVIAGEPDDQGHTHLSVLHDAGAVSRYARAVLAGADPLPVERALSGGEG